MSTIWQRDNDMGTHDFTRFAVVAALLAASVLLGVTSATAQRAHADRPGMRTAPAEVVGTMATEVRRVPWMKEVTGDCSANSVACNFIIVGAPAGVRIEVRNTYCLIGVLGESSQLQSVALTRAGQASPLAFLAPTKTVGRFGNSNFVVTHESFYFANPGDKIGVHVAAEGGDITFAICTLAGERVVLR
jgi:hypothetical protein